MLNNDLSNELGYRSYVVFEGLIGYLPPENQRRYKIDLTLHRYRRAMRNWHVFPHARDAFFNVTWKGNTALDIVTFLPADMVEPLEDWLEAVQMPYSYVRTFSSPAELTQALAHHPEVQYVFSPTSSSPFTYGSRGWNVNPEAPVLPI